MWNANPLVIVPNAEAIRAGLARDDLFTVVHEQFLTDTARYADIVLPATTQIERRDVVPAWGHLWMGWNEAAIEPLGESCSNTELFRRLAGRWARPSRRCSTTTRRCSPRRSAATVDLDELRRGRLGPGAVPGRRPAVGRRRVPDPSGKVELVSEPLGGDGPAGAADVRAAREGRTATRAGRPLPAAAADAEAPHPLPQLELLAPAQARSGRGRRRSSSSTPPTPRPAASPTATRRGVERPRLASRLPVRISERLRPGVVAIPLGWWRPSTPTARPPTP